MPEPRAPHRRSPQRLVFRLLLVAALGGGLAAGASAPTARAPLEAGVVAALVDGRQLMVEAEPRPGEGLLAFARRLCGDVGAAEAITQANGGSGRLREGLRYRVPFALLAPELQLRVARALFAADRLTPEGWVHRVGARDGAGESLWQISEWFTGRGENFPALRERNALAETDPRPGAELLVPAALLRPSLRAALPSPPSAAMAVADVPAPAAPPLEYGRDEQGEYAVYRLRRGEALYSAVVVRFAGLVFADDVNAQAAEIAKRSSIADVTDIPVGYPVKVPLELVLPEFLPVGHPRRLEYEAALSASARFRNQVTAVDLAGISVILDAGHGGRDVGASMGGVWESLYVYDIMLRVKRLLESYTAARVVPTTRDGGEFRLEERDVLAFSRGHAVLTTPPYLIQDSSVGVNLRWYLANTVHRRSASQGGPEKVVFVSIHADSLHPSLRGAMVYIPEAGRSGGTPPRRGADYGGRREVREHPQGGLSRRELVRSEGLSRELADRVLAAFRAEGLAVHPFKPVRETVIRNRRKWVPAVLRYNHVPAKILLEVCNLANAEDRALIQTRAFREKVALALVEGILGYYGAAGRPPSQAVAAAAGSR
jgi:N-acetylmuramoyl-L-alanine amidase